MTTRYLITYTNGRAPEVETSLKAARARVGPHLARAGEADSFFGYASVAAARRDPEGTHSNGVVTRISDARRFVDTGIDDCGTEYGRAVVEIVRQSIE